MYLLFALLHLLVMQEISPLISFSINKYMSMYETSSNSILSCLKALHSNLIYDY